jgi:branched-chain amino acid aminotransferase
MLLEAEQLTACELRTAGAGMVTTFERTGGQTVVIGGASTLAQASAHLPNGAYTTLRTYSRRRVLRLPQHVQRLRESVALQGTPAALEESEVRHALADALSATAHAESRVRLTFAPPRLFVTVGPFEPLPPALYESGVACITVPGRRENPHAKDTRSLTTADRTYEQLPAGRHEALLVDQDGAILEGLTSNFFAVHDGILHTEDERVLHGVTRSLVLELAGAVVEVAPTAIRTDQLPRVQECFVTSVSREVLPVTRIDETGVADGRPGPVTRELMSRLRGLVEREAVEV